MVRDVCLAEELAQDALATALAEWPKTGVSKNRSHGDEHLSCGPWIHGSSFARPRMTAREVGLYKSLD